MGGVIYPSSCPECQTRHCKPTGRANARPTIDSAKQSILPLVEVWIASSPSLLAMTMYPDLTLRHVLIEDFHRLVERHRNQLRYAALGHGDAEQTVHPRHRNRVMRDDDEARFGGRSHFMQQVAEALDIMVVERRIDLVQHADRRGVGEEHRKNQR